jgi:hypothetical protein
MPAGAMEWREVPLLLVSRVPRDKVRDTLPKVQHRQGLTPLSDTAHVSRSHPLAWASRIGPTPVHLTKLTPCGWDKANEAGKMRTDYLRRAVTSGYHGPWDGLQGASPTATESP